MNDLFFKAIAQDLALAAQVIWKIFSQMFFNPTGIALTVLFVVVTIAFVIKAIKKA